MSSDERILNEDATIIVHLEGGLVQTISSNNPALQGLRVVVVDYDVEGCDPSEIVEVEQPGGRLEEAFVREDEVVETEINLPRLLESIASKDETSLKP